MVQCNHIRPSLAPTTSAPAAYGAAADFFDSPGGGGGGRAPAPIYTGGEPFRPGPPPSAAGPAPGGEPADFLYGRSAGDVQFVHYSSNGGGGPAPGAPHLNSPDSGIGDPNVTPSKKSFIFRSLCNRS